MWLLQANHFVLQVFPSSCFSFTVIYSISSHLHSKQFLEVKTSPMIIWGGGSGSKFVFALNWPLCSSFPYLSNEGNDSLHENRFSDERELNVFKYSHHPQTLWLCWMWPTRAKDDPENSRIGCFWEAATTPWGTVQTEELGMYFSGRELA